MKPKKLSLPRIVALTLTSALIVLSLTVTASAATAKPLRVQWMAGFRAPATPARYDRVGVIKVGSARARNVLVLEPGTSAGSTYFVPLAQWLVSRLPGWQVWSVERRENLVEDQSVIDLAKRHRASPRKVFDYYLNYIVSPAVKQHLKIPNPSTLGFAKNWGLEVAVQDLHRVIGAAHRLGGKVVLGGHSLGGGVVTAYATWNFGGQPGARDLAGLVFIDGASFRSETAADARRSLATLRAGTPWLSFGGIPAPYAGVFEVTGALSALLDPNSPSLGQTFPALPSYLKPAVRVTNLGQYGYALNVGTSPASLVAAQGHLGRGVSARGPVHGWDGRGALSPIRRFATMFSGLGVQGADGVEWYFPQRLTDDMPAVGNGIANPAQSVLGVHSTLGMHLPRRLLMYAFGAALGQGFVLDATRQLATQSHIPARNLTLINRGSTYAHNDPNSAYPHNAFFDGLVPFLKKVRAQR